MALHIFLCLKIVHTLLPASEDCVIVTPSPPIQDAMDVGEEDSPLPVSLAGTPRADSMDLDTPQQRKKDKKRKKKGEEDAEMLDMGAGIKRSASALDAGGKGLDRKAPKKAKVCVCV
jgi:hypothetical protein